MPNKLRNIFSDKDIAVKATLKFQDGNGKEAFRNAVQSVAKTGEPITIPMDGKTSFSCNLTDGNGEYSFRDDIAVGEVTIGPTIEHLSVPVKTVYGEKNMEFNQICTENSVIFVTSEDEVVFARFTFYIETREFDISFRLQPQNADSINDIIEKYTIFMDLLRYLYEDAKTDEQIETIIESIRKNISIYEKLSFVEHEFHATFDLSKLELSDDDIEMLEAINILIKERKAIRVIGTIHVDEKINIKVPETDHEMKTGAEVKIMFNDILEKTIGGQPVRIYTANLLLGAVIKKVEPGENGMLNIYYSEKDSRPMYIAYRGFRTKEEAEKERDDFMNHLELYQEAKTVEEWKSSER